MPNSVVGYPALMNAYYDTIDMYLLLHDTLMPSVELSRTTAALQAARLGSNALSPVAVKNLDTCSSSTASSAVLAVAKTLVRSDYQVKLKEGVLDGTTWYGNFTVTNYSDETDTATSVRAQVEITEDFETYVRQRIDKTISNQSDEITNVVDLFNLSLSVFEEEIKKYCLSSLESFRDCCETCMNVLIEQGVANSENWQHQTPNLYSSLYEPYYNKYVALTSEIKLRESEIELIMGIYDSDGDLVTHGLQTLIEEQKTMIQDTLNFEKYLGEELWLEFIAYRREDTYSNENYISDGLDNSQLFENALEFIETAKKDIYKSANLQHSISSTLKNLLVIKAFEPLVEYFQVGNWLRIRVDKEIYRLRLVSYEVDYDEFVNELYLHLMEGDAWRLKAFEERSSIYQWLKVVAIRFFVQKRNSLIEDKSQEPLNEIKDTPIDVPSQISAKIDVEYLLNQLRNERYVMAIRRLILEDAEPKDVAEEMGVTVDNLYNIKKRAIAALTQIVLNDGRAQYER